jgi:hypothetical protein
MEEKNYIKGNRQVKRISLLNQKDMPTEKRASLERSQVPPETQAKAVMAPGMIREIRYKSQDRQRTASKESWQPSPPRLQT